MNAEMAETESKKENEQQSEEVKAPSKVYLIQQISLKPKMTVKLQHQIRLQ